MKILLFANTGWYLYNFRLAFIEALVRKGFQVVLLSPEDTYVRRFQAMGFDWRLFPISRQGLNPLSEAWTVLRLIRMYIKIKPDLVHHFTPKCVLYGSLAARLARIKAIVNSVTGLGYLFTEGEGVRRNLRGMVLFFYRLVLRPTWVIFQNPEDQHFFLQYGLVAPARHALVRSSGVDIERFSPHPPAKGTPLVILPARLLRDKGVEDFVKAARYLRSKNAQGRFALVGDTDPHNPTAIPTGEIKSWVEEGVIEWWGWQDNMASVYAEAHIVCLPSYYREGVPKTLVEAAACGLPIVASDIAGCREVVRNGENGFLVAPHDVEAIAKALLTLIKSASMRRRMGACGRRIAVAEFSSENVISQTLAVYHSITRKTL